MVKVKYNVRKKNNLIERIRNFDTFKLAIEFIRREVLPDETLVGKPTIDCL